MNRVRCAIYTRKSSEEGLEQGFNSLDAQREACAAYVLSQASEGWQLLPYMYDDGGISGGTLERPALQRLLADIAEGKIDIVVCYKVDRLSRSLFDFAKLVEAFEKADVSFVSITQSFNTTTSMGRLTLNMLLSFAQFEREVTAERIRDKIAASKAKGMWMGGTPPLGYRPDGRTLAIVEDHAALIRDIFARYAKLGNVRRLAEQLEAEGIRAPARTRVNGKSFGGCTFSRGQLYKILGNPIYVGDIPHRDKVYKGQHAAIIDRDSWERVQLLLTEHTRGDQRARLPHRSLLAGILVDGSGEPMFASHATKKHVRYRYYVSRSLQLGAGNQAQGLRLPAREIESVVKERVAQLFDDPLLVASQISLDISPAVMRRVTDDCEAITVELRGRAGGRLQGLVAQVRALDGRLEIELNVTSIANILGASAPQDDFPALTLDIEFRLTRTGRAIRLVQSDGTPARREADPALVKLIAQARKWWTILAEGEIDIKTLAAQEGVNDSYVTRIVRVAFLSPQVIDAILTRGQHGALDAAKLRMSTDIPTGWEQQAARYLPKPDRGKYQPSEIIRF